MAKKSENKTKRSREDLSPLLWMSKEYIAKKAKEYDQTPWHHAPKWWLAIWNFVSTIFVLALVILVFGERLGIYNGEGQSAVIMYVSLVVLITLLVSFLIVKGFRVIFVAIMALQIYQLISSISKTANFPAGALLITVFVVGLCITCLRIEDERAELKQKSK